MSEPSHGVATREQTAGLSGLEIVQGIAAGRLPAATISKTMGFALVEADHGRALFEGTMGDHLLNPLGTVHGGVAMTLIDSAAGCAAMTTLPPGTGWTTLETKVNFTRAIRADGGVVRCEGRVIAAGRTIITAEAKVTLADGSLAAHGTSTLLVLAPRG